MKNLLLIKRIKIYNFRSIEEININNVGDINVFVGPNEGGKSNILRALEWFSNDNEMSDDDIPKDKDVEDEETIVEIAFKINNSRKYSQKVQKNIKIDAKLLKYLEEKDSIAFHEPKYFLAKKQRNGRKRGKFFDGSGKSTEIISIDPEADISKYIEENIHGKSLDVNHIIKDGIKEFLINKGIRNPEPGSEEIGIIFNHTDINALLPDLTPQLKSIFDEDIEKIGNIKEVKKLKDKLLNHELITDVISSSKQTQSIRNMQIQWNAKDIIKKSIESYFERKFGIASLSSYKLEIPEFVLYSKKMGFKNEVKKEESWDKTITGEKYPLYYRLFNLFNIQPSELDSREDIDARQYLSNRLRNASKSFGKRWRQKKIKFAPNMGESKLSIDIVDLDEKTNDELLETFIEDRSDGFQWFLGYFITLNYIRKSETNQILLLDDPGIYLHPLGQKDLLDEFEDLSKSNQVFYSTHLISLFDEDHLDRVYLVDSENSKTQVKKAWKSEHKDVMEPLRHALGLDSIIFKDIKRILFVEGISDKFIIEGILYMNKLNNWYVYPMFGGDDITDENKIIKKIKAMQCINNFYEEKNFYFILDGDRQKLFTPFLGSINVKFEKDLDKTLSDNFTDNLKKALRENGIIISRPFVLTKIKTNEWQLKNGETYVIKKAKDRLNIYRRKEEYNNIMNRVIFMGNVDQEMEDLIDRDLYLECVREVYYPLFIGDNGKITKLNKIYASGKKNNSEKITKFLKDEFHRNILGGFSKVDITKRIKRKLISKEIKEEQIQPIIKNIKKLIEETAPPDLQKTVTVE